MGNCFSASGTYIIWSKADHIDFGNQSLKVRVLRTLHDLLLIPKTRGLLSVIPLRQSRSSSRIIVSTAPDKYTSIADTRSKNGSTMWSEFGFKTDGPSVIGDRTCFFILMLAVTVRPVADDGRKFSSFPYSRGIPAGAQFPVPQVVTHFS